VGGGPPELPSRSDIVQRRRLGCLVGFRELGMLPIVVMLFYLCDDHNLSSIRSPHVLF
jgi:hypothetical protein